MANKLIDLNGLKSAITKLTALIDQAKAPSLEPSVNVNGKTLNYSYLRTHMSEIFVFKSGGENVVGGKILYSKKLGTNLFLTYWVLIVRSDNGDFNNTKVYIEGDTSTATPVNIDNTLGYGMVGVCIPFTGSLGYASDHKIVISG